MPDIGLEQMIQEEGNLAVQQGQNGFDLHLQVGFALVEDNHSIDPGF